MEIGQAVLTGFMSFLGSGVSATFVSSLLNNRNEKKEADKETYRRLKEILNKELLWHVAFPDYYNGTPCFVYEGLKNISYLAEKTNELVFHRKKISKKFDNLVEKINLYLDVASTNSSTAKYDPENDCFTIMTTIPGGGKVAQEKKDFYVERASKIDSISIELNDNIHDFEKYAIKSLNISPGSF